MGIRILPPLAALLLAACSTTPSEPARSSGAAAASAMPAAYASGAPYEPSIDPARFVSGVTNAFFPLPVGAHWVYEGAGEADGEVDTVEVTRETKTVMGVVCVVVHDEVSRDDEAVEVTDDWYAQDAEGNVWYFGEATAEYENGEVVSTAGSWEAGVDGAMPGIIMPAQPVVDVTYRQEFYEGEAEDLAKVVETDAETEVPLGRYTGVLVTEDWTPLEPDLIEHKAYAPNMGLLMEELVQGGDESFVLVEFDAP
jgi:hypothetical protein